MSTYAVVQNGVVTNLVEWDGASDWAPPNGATLVQVHPGQDVTVGSTYSGGVFSLPPNTGIQ